MQFIETQKYSVLPLVAITCVLVSVIFIFLRYGSWTALKKTVARRTGGSLDGTPVDRMNKKLLFALCLSPFALIVVYFMLIRLDTRIDEQGVHYKMWPSQWDERTIGWDQIRRTELRDNIVGGSRYSGIQYEVYSIDDKYGLYLFLRNSKILIIGTKKPDEITRAISRYRWKY